MNDKNETRNIDVLAVMDRAIARNIERGAVKGSPSDRDMREARTAVAKLIKVVEAAAEVRAAHRELPPEDFSTARAVEARQVGEARIGRAHYALESALARAGGAA